MGDGDDDTLKSISISPRDRLMHIEESLARIDAKLDTRFDSVEGRLSAVESTQAGQASITEFAAKATALAEEASGKAADLADGATKKAADLATEAAAKATTLADEQKKFDLALIAVKARQDGFDRKVAWFGGIGAAAATAAGFVGWFIGK